MTRLISIVANTALVVLVWTMSAPVSFATETVPAELLEVMEWRMVGPYRGGRVTTVAGVPGNPQLYYMGATGGGVWKTENAGLSWENISDEHFNVGTIGAIAVAESDSQCNLRRHGREIDTRRDDESRRWRLQVDRRGCHLDPCRAAEGRTDLAHQDPPEESRHRLRRCAGPDLGAERGARGVSHDRWRPVLGTGPEGRCADRRNRSQDGPDQPADPVCGDVGARPQAVVHAFRGPRRRHLQIDRRRRQLGQTGRRPARIHR